MDVLRSECIFEVNLRLFSATVQFWYIRYLSQVLPPLSGDEYPPEFRKSRLRQLRAMTQGGYLTFSLARILFAWIARGRHRRLSGIPI